MMEISKYFFRLKKERKTFARSKKIIEFHFFCDLHFVENHEIFETQKFPKIDKYIFEFLFYFLHLNYHALEKSTKIHLSRPPI